MNNSLGDCELWPNYIAPNGYGQLSVDGKTVYAHRAMWELVNGPIPVGQVVRHKCDNRGCVRLSHLELGTYQDNSDDCTSRGRQAKGSMLPQTKLTEEQIEQIQQASGRQVDIARFFGVSQGLVSLYRSKRYARSS